MTLRQKMQGSMSFWTVMAGLCFFFNPTVAVIDFLPDFIGCILIFIGLTRVARVSSVMQDARAAFLKLGAICLGRDLLVLTVQGSSAAGEKATSLLLVTFSAAILLVWFAYSAFRTLFDGFYGLAAIEGCAPLYEESQGRAKRSKTEAILRQSFFFLIAREIACLLPELSALSASSDDLNPHHINMYEHIGIMRILAALFVLVWGIVYLVQIVKYFRLLQGQTDFREKLAQKENEQAARFPGNAVTRRHRLAFLMMVIGAFLLTDFYLDFTNIIPDALAAGFILIGVLLCKPEGKQRIIACVAAVAYAVTATISFYFASAFYDKFANAQIGHNEAADRAYTLMWGSALAEMLVFLAGLVLLLLLIRRVIDQWGGYLAVQEDSAFETRRREAFLEEFDGHLIRTFVFGFIAALFSFIYDYMKVLPASKWLRFLEFFWAFDFCTTLLFAVIFATLLGNVLSAIKQRFMYD